MIENIHPGEQKEQGGRAGVAQMGEEMELGGQDS